MNTFLNLFGRTPLTRRRAYWGLAFILPNTLGLFFFFGIPVLLAFFTSFQDWNALRPPTPVGFANFERLFADPRFWQALGNTFKLLLIVVPVGTALALGVAVILNQRLRGRSIFRVIYFLPVVTSTVAASMVWTWIFQPRYGVVGNVFAFLGWQDLNWLVRPDLVLIPVAIVTIWGRLGFDMILFLAGLQSIPRTLYDAAVVDGATRWQRFRFVTLPLLSPTTFFVLILSVISAFQIFDAVYVMTTRTSRGGVGGSASTLTYFLYDSAFVQSRYGYASAIALVLFLIVLVFTLVQLRLQRRWVYYESGDAAK